jgi:hypothetical protein
MATFTSTAAQSNAPAFYNVNGAVPRVVQRSFAIALSAGDVYQMVKVPVGAVITDMIVAFDLLGGGNATCTIGDGNSANRYFASLSTGASGTTRMSLPGGFGYAYTAEDTIDVTFSTVTSASAVGVVKLVVTYTNQNDN